MNAESNTPPTVDVSSQLGRQWLQSTNRVATGGGAHDGIVVVSIPDVSNGPDFPPEANEDSLKRLNNLVQALSDIDTSVVGSPKSEDPARGEYPAKSDSSTQSKSFFGDVDSSNTLATTASPSVTREIVDVKFDLAEPTTDWIDQPGNKDPYRVDGDDFADSDSSKAYIKESDVRAAIGNTAIATLTDAIIERFPLGAPAVLTFVGSEANRHIDETCARVATELASRKLGRILLLDADDIDQSLSKASGVGDELGFTNVVNNGHDWEKAVYGRSATGLDFMGVGTGRFNSSDPDSQLRKTVVELKREYQFICVSAGDAHSNSARLLNDVSDGSYLLVSVKNSHEAYAKSAVTEMRANGARLLGCVVTDVG